MYIIWNLGIWRLAVHLRLADNMFSLIFIAPVAKRSEKGFGDDNEPEKDQMTCISCI